MTTSIVITFQSSEPYHRVTFVAFVLSADRFEKSNERDIVLIRFLGR